MKKGIFSFLFIGILLINIISVAVSVSAITGSIGNARMILHAETGDEIEKYVLVKNVNNESVSIELSASGDLADNTDIKDKAFTLQAGKEKKAYFTINVKEEGTTETKINVKFTPVEGRNGVGLSSTVIIIAGSEGSLDEDSDNSGNENVNESGVITITKKIISSIQGAESSVVVVLLVITGFIALVLVGLLIFLIKKANKIRGKTDKIKLRKRSGKK